MIVSPLVPSETTVTIDGELQGTYPETSQFTARLGDEIRLEVVYDELQQLTQFYFFAMLDPVSMTYWFEPGVEFPVATPFTTGSIHVVPDESQWSMFSKRYDFVVDEYAEPGSSQVFFVYTDDRYGEGVARLDFEVEG